MKRNYISVLLQCCVAILAPLLLCSCASDKLLRTTTATGLVASDARFKELVEELAGIKLVPGNAVTELVNGEEFFPAMIGAIQNAQETVCFENFVWRSGEISSEFIEVLSERARAGVKVHFLVDALGSTKLDEKDWEKMRAAGVELKRYNPPRLTKFFSISHRTHRKILIVDGKTGFVGGISIADEWLCDTTNPRRWRDSNYKIEGPAVAQLQSIFAVNWKQATGQRIDGDEYFPEIFSAGPIEAACFMSGPREGEKNSRRAYLLLIASAQESIRLAHSYFLPDNVAMRLLLDARERGVKIEIITPGKININLVRRASRSRWKKLLDAGVEFYEYQPTKYHLKLMIVDDLWVTAGSVNFDARSFRINDEANFVARDNDFAANQIFTFERDKNLSRRVDPEKFRQRSVWTKFSEHLAGLLRFEL